MSRAMEEDRDIRDVAAADLLVRFEQMLVTLSPRARQSGPPDVEFQALLKLRAEVLRRLELEERARRAVGKPPR